MTILLKNAANSHYTEHIFLATRMLRCCCPLNLPTRLLQIHLVLCAILTKEREKKI
jgi:hypothetical protein